MVTVPALVPVIAATARELETIKRLCIVVNPGPVPETSGDRREIVEGDPT